MTALRGKTTVEAISFVVGDTMLARVLSSWGKMFGLSGDGAAGEDDRRAFGRVVCDVATTCQAASPPRGEYLPSRVRNVSPGGVCLRLPREFQLGELLSVVLPTQAHEPRAEVLACIVRCDEAGGEWEVGCTFATPLSEDDLARFGGPASAGADQRSWMRFRCEAEASYQLVGPATPAASQPAGVVNISGGGVGLLVAEALQVGELLSVELRRDGRAILTALASIVRTTERPGGERLVGCNFIHELPEDQLRRLLV